MRAIEPRSHHRGDEEVLIWEEEVKFITEPVEVPTSEFLTPDRLATSTVAAGEITALRHKILERGTFVAKAVCLASRDRKLSKKFLRFQGRLRRRVWKD